MPSYFTPVGDLAYRPTELTQGAWREDEQHVSVLCGLVGHVIEQHETRPEMLIGRVSFEILGQIARDDVTFQVETIRPGRTIELVEVVGDCGGRTVLRARAWRLITSDTSSVAGLELPTMPAPDECEPHNAAAEWQGNFLNSLEWLAAPGGRDGRRQVWARSPIALIEGVTIGPVASLLAMVDLANGVATRRRPNTMLFPNVELTVHLLREPDIRDGWVGLDTAVSFGDSGIGLTSTTLNDAGGAVGQAVQSLTLRLP